MKKKFLLFIAMFLLAIPAFSNTTQAATDPCDWRIAGSETREFAHRYAKVSAETPALKQALKKAVNPWNRIFKFKIYNANFNAIKRHTITIVDVDMDDYFLNEPATQAFTRDINGFICIYIDTKRVQSNPDQSLTQVITHELGHAIGLGHDCTNKHDIMYKKNSLSWHQHITPAVRRHVNKLYKGR